MDETPIDGVQSLVALDGARDQWSRCLCV